MKEGTLKVKVMEGDQPTAARIHLLDSRGEWRYAPECLAYERDCHFTTEGGFTVDLPPGKTEILIEKGKEYKQISDMFIINSGKTLSRMYHLERWIDMNTLGWFSGDTHVHRSPENMRHLMESEDLNIAPVLNFWNQREVYNWKEISDQKMVRHRSRAFGLVSQEDERQGGAIIALNLEEPVKRRTTKWYPAGAAFAEEWRKQGAIVEQEKPFWWEAPVNVALGLVDTIGIVNNHLQRTGILDREAWGRPRDTDKYPGRKGFVHNVLDLYYRYLNLGIKIPITAGSASGVLRNPLGYNRLYVKLDSFSYEEWFDGMKDGRSFATNGPMLFFRVDDALPSLTVSRPSPLTFKIDIKVKSRNGLDQVELLVNGKVSDRFSCANKSSFDTSIHFSPSKSCWIAARTFEKDDQTVRFAHSNPVFLEIPNPMQPLAEDARFYLDWCKDLLKSSQADPERYSSSKERRLVEDKYVRAIAFYDKLIRGS